MLNRKRSLARPASPQAARALQVTLIAFFALAVGFLLAVYAIAPAIYVQVLSGTAATSDTRPAFVTVFLVAILLLVSLLSAGVLRRWRWVFWLVLVAFIAQVIAVPVGALQLAGILPLDFPVWYESVRLLVSVLQIAIGGWMIWLYLRCGVWATGDAPPKALAPSGRESRQPFPER